MPLDRSSCYRALTARDPRFDGVFFVGVTSTRIYCRPVCRARTPRERNCRFFSHAAAAERAGFRPCLRCRPELAPGNAPVDAESVLAAQAAREIAAGALNGASVEALAESLGVTGRHLRRVVVQHLGVSPIDLATTHRLLLAKRLLQDTTLPVAQVAYASGFESLRRFNAAFKGRYRLTPLSLRHESEEMRPGAAPHDGTTVEPGPAGGNGDRRDDVVLTLDYRHPLHWPSLFDFLAARATPGAEFVGDGRYAATVRLPASSAADGGGAPAVRRPGAEVSGHVIVAMAGPAAARGARTPNDAGSAIVARISASLVPVLMPVLARLRDLLDLDANPEAIARHLARAGVVASEGDFAGVRIPGTLDGFALAVRAILGQQVSVRGATTVMGRLVGRFGDPYDGGHPALSRLMPTAATLARLRTADIASLGMPGARADAVLALARAVDAGDVVLAPGADAARTIRALTRLPGIGEWTAHYIAMRALRWPDAFPANDLVLRRAAGNLTAAQLTRRAESWRPWRAYAAMHLWRTAAGGAGERAAVSGASVAPARAAALPAARAAALPAAAVPGAPSAPASAPRTAPGTRRPARPAGPRAARPRARST
ncbi:MAG TPA: Ada metal-binding domain-containing protein [Gemmatimonadaceae bacterium]|nr:Ada metal-binding domain-containing protein [Gemmatimonadaceae bacterium]